jgi:hypothetical protein
MAGRPKLNALEDTIQMLGGDPFVFDLMLEHGSIAAVARDLGCSWAMLSMWSKMTPEREKAFNDIRAVYGDALLYELIELADELPDINPLTGCVDSGWVANQRNRIDTRKWVAARYNKALSDKQAPEVTVDVGSVLKELMASIKQTPQRLVQPRGATIDGEVVREVLSNPLVSGE